MISLYDKSETNFGHNGICILDNIIKSCKITNELNGQYSIELEVIKDTLNKYKNIQEFSIIKVQGQLFRLYNRSNLQDSTFSIRATLQHISTDIDTDFLEDVQVINAKVDVALGMVILDERFTILSTDMTNTATAYFVKDKPKSAIFKTILPGWGGELKRDNFNIGIFSRIGVDTGRSIEYAKNITGFEQTLDYNDIVTRMMPTGAEGCTIDLINGGSKWIESPIKNNYFKTFSREIQFDNIDDATALKAAGEALWGTIDLPKVNYRVNFVSLENTQEYKDNPIYKQLKGLDLGDSVIIKHKVFNVNIVARVIKIITDGLTGKTLEIELGQFRDSIFNMIDKLDYKIGSVNTNLETTKKDIYTKVTQTDDRITLEAARLDGDISDTRSQLEITADEISTKVSKDNVISEINQSAEGISINAQKVNLNGYVTYTNLNTPGETVIDGENLKTGSVTADRIVSTNVVVNSITGGISFQIDGVERAQINTAGNMIVKSLSANYTGPGTGGIDCNDFTSSGNAVFTGAVFVNGAQLVPGGVTAKFG